ncbi:unnamed protein product [Bemisia tabaci]|uniref:ubiquitinyl hydrolase 1 n=1 Tax=Bemisia tabaci TaxID=7038 RepID=A0A9P0C7G7_BEMTA|nr:unnamed protein product [Bemisia tabaci]
MTSMENFDSFLPAIWLVFGGSFLYHYNAPKNTPDRREKVLLHLLSSYLHHELTNSSMGQQYDTPTHNHLCNILELLSLWSEDLNCIYKIREGQGNDLQVRRLAQRLLKRVETFKNVTVIPNGLVSALHTGPSHPENVCLGVLNKQGGRINWTQVNPGSTYHQHCSYEAGEKCNSYLEITEIDPANITEDWLYLLVGLKAVREKSYYYKEVSLYECLLSHLNGKTTFQSSQPDEGFVWLSNESPVHTWQVIDKSFRCMLRNLLGDSAFQVVYGQLITNFKLFLMEKTLTAYDSRCSKQPEQCQFLLQEMCRDLAQQAFDHGNEEQKAHSFQLIKKVKAAIKNRCSLQDQTNHHQSLISIPHVLSLRFPPPNLIDHSPSASDVARPNLQVYPIYVKPSVDDDVFDYLKKFYHNFILKLRYTTDLNGISLLSYGIENYFIESLAQTDILDRSADLPLSKNDTELAETLKNMAEIYYGCQSRLVNHFLSDTTYQPQFYAKNVTIQFFIYAAIAALNLRDSIIGPLLKNYNLSINTLDKIIPHLVMDDSRWMDLLSSVKSFFKPTKARQTLFTSTQFSFQVSPDGHKTSTDIGFARLLVQNYPSKNEQFTDEVHHCETELLNQKWSTLTYTSAYLPSLYCTLSKMAYLAKVSLNGFPFCQLSYILRADWSVSHKKNVTEVHFQINKSTADSKPSQNVLTSFLLKSDPLYQRFIARTERETADIHFLENEIIASQDQKPETMGSNRYMELGFLQSEPWLKLERLYIALKEKQLDCSQEKESVLIMQTLFEVSLVMENEDKICSILGWTAHHNAELIHAFGLLCIEKVCAMQHCLTQHSAIGDLLLVTLGLSTFYPAVYKDSFIEGMMSIYHMLKEILAKPPDYVSNDILLHLNAYLLIAAQVLGQQLLETDLLTILKALVAIENFKVKEAKLNNCWLLRVRVASYNWCTTVECQLQKNPAILNGLMLSVVPEWDQTRTWVRNPSGLLFTCNNYTVKPMLGCIYFENQPIVGLPKTITGHEIFTDCLGDVNFPVIPSSRDINTQQVPCFISIDRELQLRFTLIGSALLMEERVGSDFELYLPIQELLGQCSDYPHFIKFHNQEKLQHWLLHNKERVLIKDAQRQIVFEWDLNKDCLWSSQHKGFVAPWKEIEDSSFKTWLEKIELPTWIELIGAPKSNNSGILIKSLNFPRLGLNFVLKKGQFFSQQVHGYVLSEHQHIHTLDGFSSYIVLEKKDTVEKRVKVVIPNRKVASVGAFYLKTMSVNCQEIQSPTYYVYDYDLKIGLLRGHNIQDYFYLALLYFRSASFDEDMFSHCNAYHLARENLELCWKDEPYNEIELNVIEELLKVSGMRCHHSHLAAIYLKVVSLLSESLQRAFLFMDEITQQNKIRSEALLKYCAGQAPHILQSYLKNESNIFTRIKLTHEEKEAAMKHCSASESSKACKFSYNNHYKKFFAKEELLNTAFMRIFEQYRSSHFEKYGYNMNQINFTAGFNLILTERFRFVQFIVLYKIARSSYSVTPSKFQYLLHHLMIRAEIKSQYFPAQLANMLARALLLVAEHRASFPEAPSWFKDGVPLDLTNRTLDRRSFDRAFPTYSWQSDAEVKETQKIWALLSVHHLDETGVPNSLPDNPENCTLKYENYMSFINSGKRDFIRREYLKAAYNDASFQFFVSVFQQCDRLKYRSSMGKTVAPFIYNTIEVASPWVKVRTPFPESVVSSIQVVTPEEFSINWMTFFRKSSQPAGNNTFPLESQLGDSEKGYEEQFFKELKNSWSAYLNEKTFTYSWQNSRSAIKLETLLRKNFDDIRNRAEQVWNKIEGQLTHLSSNEQNNYFALRWYSGQLRHFNKCDVLRLLIEPHKLPSFNPDCCISDITQEIVLYTYLEINSSKIVRVLALIEEYKQITEKSEKFSILQSLVSFLQENIDPESYSHPNWLLFQFENEIIVRDKQRELIIAMLNQSEKAMYQLNMGEGKSSVIVPLLSYSLADGKQLLRINVLSALSTTMKEFLRRSFSGLIHKHVSTLPFTRDTDISIKHLEAILTSLETCRNFRHILLVTPEHRLSMQLKIRELVLENQQQIHATNIFNWKTYRQRVHGKMEVYNGLSDSETEELLRAQDQRLRSCLQNAGYINANDSILKVPPRGQGRKHFAQFKDIINDSKFREWSCLKAAHRELLYNSTIAFEDCREKLSLLYKINELAVIDLLDESDEILKHGTELNYTMGDKHMFAGGEFRWKIPQFFIKSIFCDSDIRDVIDAGKADGFTEINLQFSLRGGVPFIQLLDKTYYNDQIKPLLIDKFLQENLSTFRKYYCCPDKPLVEGENSSLKEYINGQLQMNIEKKVIDFLADKDSLKEKLLIAKGWLSHGILFHVFNAKYRVRYGLNLPKIIAIPFLGKDTPSLRSEFSHPDVMLGFTIISYLYEGLNPAQMQETLNKLRSKFSLPVADAHLQSWSDAGRAWIETQTDEFPPLLLTSLQYVYLENKQCLEQVHKFLSGNSMAIFFYLDEFVFLEEAMQYLKKISANAHSLVGYNAALGFSGTDDRKITMPFEIKSLCSSTQKGTNGKLLSVLTQERNKNYHSIEAKDTENLLGQLCEYASNHQQCHALIDSGALVTGLSNYNVAKFLLKNLPSHLQGILYFSDKSNRLTVLQRDEKTVAFQDCYLDKKHLFAYLDDIHTRGTDIKLPLNSHAILTIGIGMSKDSLMQAAMRLRQLAQKQSVSLWGTLAVTIAITRDNNLSSADEIDSLEVIKWVTQNTLDHIHSDLFSVAVRKINFQFLKNAENWWKVLSQHVDSLKQHFQEIELFELEDFYGLSSQYEDLNERLSKVVSARLKTFWKDFERIQWPAESISYEKFLEHKDNFECLLNNVMKELQPYLRSGYVHHSLDTNDENEIEAEEEIIQEQEVVIKIGKQKVRSEIPWDARLILQDDFITIAEQKDIIMPLQEITDFIEVPELLENITWHENIFMTTNYILSVECSQNQALDNYLRLVDVILIHNFNGKSIVVLLSGREASRIKSSCYNELDHNLLIHIKDINGPTQLPLGKSASKEVCKLLTVVKLFSGECQYISTKEVHRIAKRLGRIYPLYFTCSYISEDCSEKLFGILVEESYLDYSGVMTKKLLDILCQANLDKFLSQKCQSLLLTKWDKLCRIFSNLIISPRKSLKESHKILKQWIETRGRLKEYSGSALESVLNPEYEPKRSQLS